MPDDWIVELQQAAEQVDAEIVLQLCDRIPETEARLANTLTDWVNNFRFDKIIDCTTTQLSQQTPTPKE